jgi:sulfite reductase (NADPH) hemoprotein beta-component
LGVTASREAAARLSGSAQDLRVRVSGCQNGCAQPTSGDIGLHGEGRRLHGTLIPHYRMHFGGDGRVGGGGIAIKGPEVPTARITHAVQRVQDAFAAERRDDEPFRAWAVRRGAEFFNTLLHDLTQISVDEVASLRQDYGETQDFKVLQLGGGECAGISDEYVAARFAEADNERRYRQSFFLGRKPDEALECCDVMLTLGAQAILFTVEGKNARKDNGLGITARLSAALQDTPDIVLRYGTLAQRVADLRGTEFPESEFQALARAIDTWLVDARDWCNAQKMGLQFGPALGASPKHVTA